MTTTVHEVVVAHHEQDHAKLAADLLAEAIEDAISKHGVARVALSGGTTPSKTYQELAARQDIDFTKVEWWWVDERAVPPSDARSNYAAAFRDLGLREDGSRGKIHRMRGEAASLEEAAHAYEHALRGSFGVASAVAFDAMTLGIGDDGHTASLFPGLGVVGIDDRLVLAVPAQPAKKLEARITLATPVILEARLIVVLARGASKRAIIQKARSQGSEEEIPSRITQRARGRVVWVLDEAANS